jgi:hypothetical protein
MINKKTRLPVEILEKVATFHVRKKEVSLKKSYPDAHSQNQRTPMGGRGPKLLLELWADGSESIGADRLLSPLPALALAEPVRLRT